MSFNYVRLPIKNAYNVRDLGGYACKGGQITAFHSFLRGDDLSLLDEEDMEFLIHYGVTGVVDLRSAEETQNFPDPFEHNHKVNYINISISVGNITDVTQVVLKEPKNIMKDFYKDILKEASQGIRSVFEFIAGQEGCILFHCMAGKDRTGIVAMLLLGLAGVGTADIVANYMVSNTYNRENQLMQEAVKGYASEIMESRPEYIRTALDEIFKNYQGIEAYLTAIGVTDEVMDRVKGKLYVQVSKGL